MHKWLTLVLTLISTLAIAAPAWRWVDANGTVHYSDRPVPGAVEVDLPDANRRPVSSSARRVDPRPILDAAAPESPAYTRFDIVSPAQQETFWNVGGIVSVDVALSPALQSSHRLDLMLDGQRQDMAGTGSQFTLTDVFRGIHTVQAVIVDSANNVVLQSLPVQFMVQQTSVQNPNNPN